MRYLTKMLVFLLLLTNLYSSENLEKITLRLDWKYQFQYAGFITAVEKGFYREVGLDVEILEYENGVDVVEEVLSNKVDMGFHNSSLIIKDGVLQPMVLLATYFQKSPLVFVTQPDIKKPSDLISKKIMRTKEEISSSSLSLLLEHFFIDSLHVSHSFNIDDFKDKKVDAMSAFISNEIYELQKQNVPYNIIDPADYGFVTSATNLFTS